MGTTDGFELEIYKKLGVQSFNKAWDYIDIQSRTKADEMEMLGAAHASLWLWGSFPGKTNTNLSIGLWQVSRVYALLDEAELAIRYANKCIETSEDPSVDSFYLAYGYEALARAYMIKGDFKLKNENIGKAKAALSKSTEKETAGLLDDINSLLKQ